MEAFSAWHVVVLLAIVVAAFGAGFAPLLVVKSRPGERANTWKPRTTVFASSAVFVPLWPISTPVFAVLAYRSYKSGSLPDR